MAASSKRHGRPLCVAVLDVDHFKSVNDTYGHAAGDIVLAEIAQRIKRQLRLEDFAARWGGEEFLLLLPMTDSAGALEVAERLRLDVLTRPFDIEAGVSVSVSVSIGLSQGVDVDSLLRDSDHALYEAKDDGRNCVRMAT